VTDCIRPRETLANARVSLLRNLELYMVKGNFTAPFFREYLAGAARCQARVVVLLLRVYILQLIVPNTLRKIRRLQPSRSSPARIYVRTTTSHHTTLFIPQDGVSTSK